MMIHDIMDLSTVLATHTRFATSNQTECLVGDRVRRFDRQHRHGGAVQSKREPVVKRSLEAIDLNKT